MEKHSNEIANLINLKNDNSENAEIFIYYNISENISILESTKFNNNRNDKKNMKNEKCSYLPQFSKNEALNIEILNLFKEYTFYPLKNFIESLLLIFDKINDLCFLTNIGPFYFTLVDIYKINQKNFNLSYINESSNVFKKTKNIKNFFIDNDNLKNLDSINSILKNNINLENITKKEINISILKIFSENNVLKKEIKKGKNINIYNKDQIDRYYIEENYKLINTTLNNQNTILRNVNLTKHIPNNTNSVNKDKNIKNLINKNFNKRKNIKNQINNSLMDFDRFNLIKNNHIDNNDISDKKTQEMKNYSCFKNIFNSDFEKFIYKKFIIIINNLSYNNLVFINKKSNLINDLEMDFDKTRSNVSNVIPIVENSYNKNLYNNGRTFLSSEFDYLNSRSNLKLKENMNLTTNSLTLKNIYQKNQIGFEKIQSHKPLTTYIRNYDNLKLDNFKENCQNESFLTNLKKNTIKNGLSTIYKSSFNKVFSSFKNKSKATKEYATSKNDEYITNKKKQNFSSIINDYQSNLENKILKGNSKIKNDENNEGNNHSNIHSENTLTLFKPKIKKKISLSSLILCF